MMKVPFLVKVSKLKPTYSQFFSVKGIELEDSNVWQVPSVVGETPVTGPSQSKAFNFMYLPGPPVCPGLRFVTSPHAWGAGEGVPDSVGFDFSIQSMKLLYSSVPSVHGPL